VRQNCFRFQIYTDKAISAYSVYYAEEDETKSELRNGTLCHGRSLAVGGSSSRSGVGRRFDVLVLSTDTCQYWSNGSILIVGEERDTVDTPQAWLSLDEQGTKSGSWLASFFSVHY
jgi:hypothetical protein